MNNRTINTLSSSPKRFEQREGATLDYYFDWSAQLGADTIATSTWESDTASISGDTYTGNITTAMAYIDQPGEHEITNTITTAAGLTDFRTITVVAQ